MIKRKVQNRRVLLNPELSQELLPVFTGACPFSWPLESNADLESWTNSSVKQSILKVTSVLWLVLSLKSSQRAFLLWSSLFVLALLVDLSSLNHYCLCLGQTQIALSTQGCLSAESWTFRLGCRHLMLSSWLTQERCEKCLAQDLLHFCHASAISATVKSKSQGHLYTDFTALHWFHAPELGICWTETLNGKKKISAAVWLAES